MENTRYLPGKDHSRLKCGAGSGKRVRRFGRIGKEWQNEMKMLKKMMILTAGAFAFAAFIASGIGLEARAAEAVPEAVYVQMPGFVVEQWSAPRLLTVQAKAYVRELPDKSLSGFGTIVKGQFVNVWGQTDTGWYFVEYEGRLGYVRCEAGGFASQEQILQQQAEAVALAQQQALEAARQQAEAAALAQQQAQAAALAQQEAARQQAQAAALAQQQALEAQIAAAAQQQPAVAAGVVFIGDSRMVTLKEAVEKNLGVCPAAVIAKNGSRYEWFHDTAIPQADKIIGNGSKVVINMGVNDLSDADKYAKDVNYWAAVWSARGAQIYYASVNPVYANSYGMTEERVGLFNTRLQSQLIPQITWLDSNTYLKQTGVHSNDGLHYKDDTNLNLFHYYMAMIGAM